MPRSDDDGTPFELDGYRLPDTPGAKVHLRRACTAVSHVNRPLMEWGRFTITNQRAQVCGSCYHSKRMHDRFGEGCFR